MKKVNRLVLSTLTAAFLVGCGGGSSSSTSTTDTSTSPTTPTASSTTIPVTKGSLLMATAIDSGSPVKIGTQIDGTNKYTFTGDITYPITVTGGYVDVNDNGIVDEGDYSFKGKLSSYSTVVTPITTYLGDTSKDAGKTKLDALKTLAGITSDDDLLKNDPSETNGNVLALVASIYQSYPSLMDNDNSNDSNTEGNQDLSTKFADYKSVISQGAFEGETVKQKMIRVEQQLRDNSGVAALSEFDVKKMNLSKKDFIGKKLVVENETYYFRENDIVLGDSGDDYSQILSYGDLENGTLKVNFSNGVYGLIALTETGHDISYFEEGRLSTSFSITSKLVTYTDDELTQVLADIPFALTEDMLLGKKFDVTEGTGYATIRFKFNGIYSESWGDTADETDTGSCDGTWTMGTNNTVAITCGEGESGNSTLTFNKKPKEGSTFTYLDKDEKSGTLTISNVSHIISIENTFAGVSLKGQTYYNVWFGASEIRTGDVPVVEKVVIDSEGKAKITGIVNSNANNNIVIGVKENKIFAKEKGATEFENGYLEYVSGSFASGCIQTNWINPDETNDDNVDLLFTDETKALNFASDLTATITGCPSE